MEKGTKLKLVMPISSLLLAPSLLERNLLNMTLESEGGVPATYWLLIKESKINWGETSTQSQISVVAYTEPNPTAVDRHNRWVTLSGELLVHNGIVTTGNFEVTELGVNPYQRVPNQPALAG